MAEKLLAQDSGDSYTFREWSIIDLLSHRVFGAKLALLASGIALAAPLMFGSLVFFVAIPAHMVARGGLKTTRRMRAVAGNDPRIRREVGQKIRELLANPVVRRKAQLRAAFTFLRGLLLPLVGSMLQTVIFTQPALALREGSLSIAFGQLGWRATTAPALAALVVLAQIGIWIAERRQGSSYAKELQDAEKLASELQIEISTIVDKGQVPSPANLQPQLNIGMDETAAVEPVRHEFVEVRQDGQRVEVVLNSALDNSVAASTEIREVLKSLDEVGEVILRNARDQPLFSRNTIWKALPGHKHSTDGALTLDQAQTVLAAAVANPEKFPFVKPAGGSFGGSQPSSFAVLPRPAVSVIGSGMPRPSANNTASVAQRRR